MTSATTTERDSLPPADGPAPGDHRQSALGYLAGLDGLRGIAVSAVFLFHANVLSGGFLGVDVFFVISGFLITALAVNEIELSGRLSIGRFWARRVRRLLPAMYLLCSAVVLWALANPPVPSELGRDVVSTLTYVANWVRVGDGYEYFAAYAEPSLLEHTWSLAIEEQFYLVWPVMLVGAVALAKRTHRSPRTVIFSVAAVAAVASTLWSWYLVNGDQAQLNRLYFGTDTRAVGLAVGCAAGCLLAKGSTTGSRRAGAAQTTLGIASSVVLLALMWFLDGSERWLYGPGFALVALASLAIVNLSICSGPVQRGLAFAPLARLGRVSYGVYLWHWPVIVVLDADRTGLSGPMLGALWVAVTALLTATSWWLVEQRAPLPTRNHPGRAVGYAAVAVVVGAAAVWISAADPVGGATAEVVAPPGSSVRPGVETALPRSDSSEIESLPSKDLPADRPLRLLIIGDSVAESLGEPLSVPMPLDGGSVTVVNRSVIACPVTYEGRWAFDDGRVIADPPVCDTDDRFDADVAEVDPDVVLLMFGWSGTIAGRELPDGTIIAPCEPEFDQRYAAEFDRMVDRFDDVSTVVVATVAPPSEFRDPDQSDRPGCLNRVIQAGGYQVFDFGEWLCPESDCSAAEPLRRDVVHFSSAPEVREVVWPAIVDQVISAAGY